MYLDLFFVFVFLSGGERVEQKQNKQKTKQK